MITEFDLPLCGKTLQPPHPQARTNQIQSLNIIVSEDFNYQLRLDCDPCGFFIRLKKTKSSKNQKEFQRRFFDSSRFRMMLFALLTALQEIGHDDEATIQIQSQTAIGNTLKRIQSALGTEKLDLMANSDLVYEVLQYSNVSYIISKVGADHDALAKLQTNMYNDAEKYYDYGSKDVFAQLNVTNKMTSSREAQTAAAESRNVSDSPPQIIDLPEAPVIKQNEQQKNVINSGSEEKFIVTVSFKQNLSPEQKKQITSMAMKMELKKLYLYDQ